MGKAAKQNIALLLAVLLLLSVSVCAWAEEPSGVVYFCDSVFAYADAEAQSWQQLACKGTVYPISGSPDGETAVKELLSGSTTGDALYGARQAHTVVIAEGMTALLTVLDSNREAVTSGDFDTLQPALAAAAAVVAECVGDFCDAVQVLNPAARIVVVGVYNPFPEEGFDGWYEAGKAAAGTMNGNLSAAAAGHGACFVNAGSVAAVYAAGSIATGTDSLEDLSFGASPWGAGAQALAAAVGVVLEEIAVSVAAEPVVISAKPVSAGTVLTVEYSITANHGFSAAALQLKYDKTVLDLVGVEPGLLTGLTLDAASGICRYAGDTVYENGVLFTASFVVKDNTADTAVTLYPTLTDGDGEQLPAAEEISCAIAASVPQETSLDLSLRLDLTGIGANITAEADGIAVAVLREGNTAVLTLPNDGIKTLVVTEYSSAGGDENLCYPAGVYVWRVTPSGNGFAAERLAVLDQCMQYAGVSVSAGETAAVRYLASVPGACFDALRTGSLTLQEFGILSDRGTTAAARTVLYTQGGTDLLLKEADGMRCYAVTVDGIGAADAAETLVFRPYMMLCDENGTAFTVYGGTVRRTVGYLAWRNRNAFTPGSAGSVLMEQLINAAYGSHNPYA